jgi:trehalose synthase
MYGTLALQPKVLDEYRKIAGDAAIDEIKRRAEPLQGLRVLHLSVTAFGTGVAELLNSAVPVLSDIGLSCQWQVVRPTEEFASCSKALYRSLAGISKEWSAELAETWLGYSRMNAELLTEEFDVIVVHDPQPAAIRSFVSEDARRNTRWVFRSHLDLSDAEPAAWQALREHIKDYDALVFDADAFVHSDMPDVPLTIIPPAIDPLGPRNMELPRETIESVLLHYGIDPQRPLICQLSPCDPSCDFLGCMDIYEQVTRQIPDVQLALIAANSPEDPASVEHFDASVRRSMEYVDVHILRGTGEVGNVEINAFQRASGVVIQKGLRKGFGLWISDAQWKERPVVTASSGGLSHQVIDGVTGLLASSVDDFSEKIVRILREPELARRLGEAGRQYVQEHFLLPRLIIDELRLLGDLAGAAR